MNNVAKRLGQGDDVPPVENVPPQNLIGRPAVELLGERIPQNDPPVGVGRDNRLLNGLQDLRRQTEVGSRLILGGARGVARRASRSLPSILRHQPPRVWNRTRRRRPASTPDRALLSSGRQRGQIL